MQEDGGKDSPDYGLSSEENLVKLQRLEEESYLAAVVDFIRSELMRGVTLVEERREEMRLANQDMWENGAHSGNDFTKMTELNNYLMETAVQDASINSLLRKLKRYQRMLPAPYFARFDFRETGRNDEEKIYIGLANVMDDNSYQIYIYDWRTPIAGIFYQYEAGAVSFQAPQGKITGTVGLKRQFKIKRSKLEYFFDSDIRVTDEILQEALSRHASGQMRHIVETIQREQDRIIRDLCSQLVIVQGVAGSGKTSVALHRIAFLLYNGAATGLCSQDFVVISPNNLFSSYIAAVLPELGEENVAELTFNQLWEQLCSHLGQLETRNQQLEALLNLDGQEREVQEQGIQFKKSPTFLQMLDALVEIYEQRLHPLADIYLDGKVVISSTELRGRLLRDRRSMPLIKRLQRIESRIFADAHQAAKQRLQKIQQHVATLPEHDLEVKSYSRLLSMKQSRRLQGQLQRMKQVDVLGIYRRLFKDRNLFYRLAPKEVMPEAVEEIRQATEKRLGAGKNLAQEDGIALMYLWLRLSGSSEYARIRHLVVDEAQDYGAVHYAILKILFRSAGVTLLGDMQQSIARQLDSDVYHVAANVLERQPVVEYCLQKGYRSSFEIYRYARRILEEKAAIEAYQRHEQDPLHRRASTSAELLSLVVQDIRQLQEEGMLSIAVLTRSRQEAVALQAALLTQVTECRLAEEKSADLIQGVVVLPGYGAKGLEFDAVLVYDVSEHSYRSALDRRLLYIACTRALHRLFLYYCGQISPLLKFVEGEENE
jgi:DNA helicase-2/ATP-dependent DNA helicase PcrA